MSIRLAVAMGATVCVGMAVYESWNLCSSEDHDFWRDGAAVARVAVELGLGSALIQTLPELHAHTPWTQAKGIFLRNHSFIFDKCDRAVRKVFGVAIASISGGIVVNKNLFDKGKNIY